MKFSKIEKLQVTSPSIAYNWGPVVDEQPYAVIDYNNHIIYTHTSMFHMTVRHLLEAPSLLFFRVSNSIF
jgi:hypothetical protein